MLKIWRTVKGNCVRNLRNFVAGGGKTHIGKGTTRTGKDKNRTDGDKTNTGGGVFDMKERLA
jgi:hypothetical protein